METSYRLTYNSQLECGNDLKWDFILTSFKKSHQISSWIPEQDLEIFNQKINSSEPFSWNIKFSSDFLTRYYIIEIAQAESKIEITPLVNLIEYQDDVLNDYKFPSIKKTLSSFVHDFNNHLTVLIPNLEAAQMFSQPESKSLKYLTSAMKGCEALNKYAQLIMTMCRSPRAMIKIFTLNNSVEILKAELNEKYPQIKVNFNLPADLRICFYQEFFNDLVSVFIKNTAENSETDTVDISFSEFQQEISFALPHYGLQKANYVLVSISQTSTAPTYEVQSRMFDPFFTTRSKGKDEGVGLAIAKSMMESAGGTLKFIPSSVGCSFQLIFQKG